MNAVVDKKPTNAATKDQKQIGTEQTVFTDTPNTPAIPVNELQNAISALDEEMKATLKNAVDQLVPGASFNPALVKEISKIETRKIRLITGRLDVLIRKGNPEVKDVVDRLLAIAI
jgi:hypothetical protein